jgi:hypothetical protein
MQIAPALRSRAARRHGDLTQRLGARKWPARSLFVLAISMAGCGLAGCGSDLIDSERSPRVSRAKLAQERVALLKRQPPPNCEYRATREDSAKRQADSSPPPGDANPDAALRTKLDYERQCYRHAEMIARARLTSLQGAIQNGEKAASYAEGSRSAP